MGKNSPTYNPTRRNRKIGTADQGFKRRKRFDIPKRWDDGLVFWEQLKNPVAISCAFGTHQFWILVEPTLTDYQHHVTPQDILALFREIPHQDRLSITSVILRQPTRKQSIFSPVWGRMGYWAELGKYSGPAIMLEAFPTDGRIIWGKKGLKPEDRRELELLTSEGHNIIVGKRDITLETSPESVRQTQLFRTFAHEIGHLVHLDTWTSETDYFSLPTVDKEMFANKYATQFNQRLTASGKAPFKPIVIKPGDYDGVDPAWFRFNGGPSNFPSLQT